MTKLSELGLAQKVSITGFLATGALGLCASALLYSAADGRPSLRALLSPQSVRLRHSASPLERAWQTTMREYVREPTDLETIGRWIEAGSPRHGYYESVRPLLKRDCLRCHGRASTVSGATSLDTYADVLPYAVSRGEPIQQIALRAHVHLFGGGLVLLVLTLLVSATAAPQRWRMGVSTALWGSLAAGVLSQYLAQLHVLWAYLTWLSGLGLAISFTAALGLIIREMWFR